jgi:ABC-type sugar transport system permease subunit
MTLPASKIKRMGYVFILPFMLFFITFNLYPVIYSLALSFYDWNGIGRKTFVGFQNYIRLFTTDPYFLKSILNTLIFLVGSLPVMIGAGLVIATMLTKKGLKGVRFFQTAQFLPYIVAPVSVAMIFMLLFDWSTGMVNQILLKLGILTEGLNWLGDPKRARLVVILLIIWCQQGYIVTLFLAGMTNISGDLLEAAEVDGANYFQKLTKIIIPLLKNIILFVVITGTIGGLQLFDAPQMLFNSGMTTGSMGGPERSCLTAVWYLIDTSFGRSTGLPAMGYGAAISYSLFMIIALISFANYSVINRRRDK